MPCSERAHRKPASMPSFILRPSSPIPSSHLPSAEALSLSLEALNEQGVVLDSVAFGHFTYWRPGPSPFPL